MAVFPKLALQQKRDKQPNLPLTLNRKLGEATPIVVPPIATPKKRQNPPVLSYHGAMSDTHSVAWRGNITRRGRGVVSDFSLSYAKALFIANCQDFYVLAFRPVANKTDVRVNSPYLLANAHHGLMRALRHLANAHHVSIGGGVGLYACHGIKSSAKQYLQNCTHGNVSNVIHLANADSQAYASSLIHNQSTHNITHSVPVPCRYYPLPEKPPDKPVSYCDIRPTSDKLPLALRRKGGFSARALPLQLICWHDIPPATVPNLGVFIVHNTISATVGGVHVNPLSFSIKTDMDSFCWQGQMDIPKSDFIKIKDKSLISFTINGFVFVIMAENVSKNRSFIGDSYTLSGRSVTAQLSQDYATNKDGGLAPALYASQLCNSAVADTGMSVEYKAVDWLIGVYSTDKTPIAILSDVANACGAFVASHASLPKLTIRPRYKVSAWELATAEPDLIVTLDPVRHMSESKQVNPLYDSVWLSSSKRLDKVYRKQSAQTSEAPVQSDELYTDQIATIAKGIQVLSDSGTHMDISMTIRWTKSIPLAVVGDVWQIQDDGGYKAIVTSVEVQVKLENDVPTVWQVVGLNRYMGE